jgi:glycosyltransferase involved in cell wall biosynthesis
MIETFIISWNEADTIEFTIKHYLKLGKVNLYDNYSTDGTPDIADKLGAFVESYGTNELNENEYLKIKNHAWKGSKADYVIVCDVDEILQVDLKTLEQEKSKGVTIFETFGWDIYSNKFPKKEWSEINEGFHNTDFSKKVIFSPKLKGINYEHGCHRCTPNGDLRFSEVILPLFHYRNVGGPDRVVERHKQYRKRLSKFNRQNKLTTHYLIEETRKRKLWKQSLEKSVPFSPDIMY